MVKRLTSVAGLIILAACTKTAAPCPAAPEALASADLAVRDEDPVAAQAIVQRFVPAPDPQYRGYDIQIVTRLAGLGANEQIMFVRADSKIDTIEPGDEVFVFGERGPQPAEISSSGGCPVLTPLDP